MSACLIYIFYYLIKDIFFSNYMSLLLRNIWYFKRPKVILQSQRKRAEIDVQELM